MSGDELARGAKKASYQVRTADSDYEHDLKTLSGAGFVEKYDCRMDQYSEVLDRFELGQPFISYPLRHKPEDASASEPLIPQVEVGAALSEKLCVTCQHQESKHSEVNDAGCLFHLKKNDDNSTEYCPCAKFVPAATSIVREVPHVQYHATALGDQVLVVRVEETHTATLIIPKSAKEKEAIGRVIARGPDVKRCAVGDLVLFDSFAAQGKELKLVQEETERWHLLLNDEDIFLKLERLAPRGES